jgi:hypothetical protein
MILFLLDFDLATALGTYPGVMSVAPSVASQADIQYIRAPADACNLASHILLVEAAIVFFSQEQVNEKISRAATSFCDDLLTTMPMVGPHRQKFGPYSPVTGTVHEPSVSSLLAIKLAMSLTLTVQEALELLGPLASVFPVRPVSHTPLVWRCEESFPTRTRTARSIVSPVPACNAFATVTSRDSSAYVQPTGSAKKRRVGLMDDDEDDTVGESQVQLPAGRPSQGRADIVLNADFSEIPLRGEPENWGVLPIAFFELGKKELHTKEVQEFCIAVGLAQHAVSAKAVYPILGVSINAREFACHAYIPFPGHKLGIVTIVPCTPVSPDSVARLLRVFLYWSVGVHQIMIDPPNFRTNRQMNAVQNRTFILWCCHGACFGIWWWC